jgi:hypothetical protein
MYLMGRAALGSTYSGSFGAAAFGASFGAAAFGATFGGAATLGASFLASILSLFLS